MATVEGYANSEFCTALTTSLDDFIHKSLKDQGPPQPISVVQDHTRLIAGIVMIFTLGKQNEDSMIEKLNFLHLLLTI